MVTSEEVISNIYDLGTFKYRTGLSGMDKPFLITTPVLGLTSDNNILHTNEQILNYTSSNLKILDIMSNVNGYIDNIDLFEEYLDTFLEYNKNIYLISHPFIFSEPAIHNKEKRMEITKLMFEKFNINAFFMCNSSVFSSFSIGKISCMIIDSGKNYTTIAPITDGMIVKKGLTQTHLFSGTKSNEILIQQVNDLFKYYNCTQSLKTFKINNILNDIKNQINFGNDKQNIILPDNKEIEINVKSYDEKLFKDKLTENNNCLSRLIFESIIKCDNDIKKDLYSNIFFCGGNSSVFQHHFETIDSYLLHKVPQNTAVKCFSFDEPENRTNSAWLGASILSSLNSFKQFCVVREEYSENGPAIIQRKCA